MSKTIIAGVDFSKSSYNAADYAAMLAQKLNCKLVLFNMYEVPLLHSNSGLYFMSNAPIKEESEKNINLFYKKLKSKHPKIQIDTYVSTGSFKKQLAAFIKTHEVQLVVMGLKAKERFSKFLYGSHSTDIIGTINAPVIIVPDNFKVHKLQKMVLGIDSREKLHKSPLTQFQTFVKGTGTPVTLLHVKTEDEIFQDKTPDSFKINGKNQKIESYKAASIDKGIITYAKQKKVDLVALISKKHSIFYNLFNESHTKEIAFTSNVPVMSIHE